MAYYAALTTLVQLLEDIILNERYPGFRLGKHPVMETLHKNFTLLEESLEGYSSKGDEASDHVEGRIREVAHRAQDVIELEIFCQDSAQERSSEEYVQELEMVNHEVDSVLEEMEIIKERQTNADSKLISVGDSSCLSARKHDLINTNVMVGFDDNLTVLKGQLCGQSSQLHVIPIVGTGGIGKTTLARHTYEEALVVYRFDLRAWVVVSQDFNMNQFLQTIAKSLGITTDGLPGNDEGALQEAIYKRLKGMRYLIVIDDIWSTEVWNDVKQIFPNDNNGSRIMLTTRLSDVAEYASTSHFLHKMRYLNDDQSWNLLQKKVFGQEHCPAELEDVGKLIARNCCGLPLAIVVIAGVISTRKTSCEWEKVESSVRRILSDTDEHLSSILNLSYNHLSHQLKACFLYMGNFPEDQEINVSNLIKLLVAEGFLKLTDKTKTLEEIAEECLEDLVKRNLVLVTKKRSNGRSKFCVFHDLLRDFCRQRGFHENFFHVEQEDGHLHLKDNGTVRQISWYHNIWNHQHDIGKLVRSMHFFGATYGLDFDSFEWDDLKLLRVFNAFESRDLTFRCQQGETSDDSNFSPPSAPDMMRIGRYGEPWIRPLLQRANLKYLGLDSFSFQRAVSSHPGAAGFNPFSFARALPHTFMFRNLQTLITPCVAGRRIHLPAKIWEMTQLRHLVVPKMVLPSSFDNRVRKLECLQTLMTVRNFRFTSDAVQMIPNLRKLKISYDAAGFDKRSWELHCLDNLINLSRLEELKIKIKSHCMNESLPNKFCFPLNITKLSLERCRLPWEDLTTFVGSLPRLRVLRLKEESFVGKEWETKEEQFLHLKFLSLQELDLKYWRSEETHLPRLEHLEIRLCPNLETVPLEIGDIPTLTVIKVVGGSNRVRESVLRIQEEQMNLGNDSLQVYAG